MAGAQILLVEDDERIGSSLTRALTGTGYSVSWERTGTAAVRASADRRPDLVLLDLGLPDVDGLEVCRTLQAACPDLAVVMLTARDEELDVVIGLDAGAIDYITKPFKLAELLARVRAQLRQSTGASTEVVNADHDVPEAVPGVVAGDVRVDRAARRAWVGEVELELRPKEFDLLARLVTDAGRVVRRETLMAEVWDEHWFGSTKTLDFHIALLRRKLDSTPGISHISTLRGVGYRFEVR